MVRYTRPPSPTWQATTRSAPTKHLSDQHGQMAVIKSQANENKGVIWMIKAVLAADDESDEGASPLLDMTKVTRSTLADKTQTLPERIIVVSAALSERTPAWLIVGFYYPTQPHQAKPNDKTPYIDKFVEPELIFSTCHFSF